MQAQERNPVLKTNAATPSQFLEGPATRIHARPGKAQFQYSLENLRGLAILFVILSHITSFELLGKPGEYLAFFFSDATTWFVFIAGYLFNYIEQKKFDYRDYLGKKARFVILPYLILSILAIAAGLTFERHLVLGLTTENYVLWSLMVGGAVIVPMWFIPMIALFFLLSPLFNRLGKNRLQYPAVVIGLIASLYTARPIENLNPFLEFVHFAGFYLLGIVFSANHARIEALKERHSTTPVIVGALLLFGVSSIICLSGEYSEAPDFMEGLGKFNNIQFGKLVLLVAVFFLFDRFLNMPNRFFGWMANISFGLFFMQGFFMALFQKLAQKIWSSEPLVMLGAELTLVLGGSMVAVTVIKYILGKRSRYVIGC